VPFLDRASCILRNPLLRGGARRQDLPANAPVIIMLPGLTGGSHDTCADSRAPAAPRGMQERSNEQAQLRAAGTSSTWCTTRASTA